MNVKLINFKPIETLAIEVAYRLKQTEGLPFLKGFRHESTVPRSVRAPRESPDYKFCLLLG